MNRLKNKNKSECLGLGDAIVDDVRELLRDDLRAAEYQVETAVKAFNDFTDDEANAKRIASAEEEGRLLGASLALLVNADSEIRRRVFNHVATRFGYIALNPPGQPIEPFQKPANYYGLSVPSQDGRLR